MPKKLQLLIVANVGTFKNIKLVSCAALNVLNHL